MLLTEYTTQNATVTLTSSSTDQQLGQGFYINRIAHVGKIRLYLAREGSPGGYLQVELQGDASGVPDGEENTNGISEPILVSGIGEALGWVDFEFDVDVKPQLSSTATYHIVLRAAGGYTQSSGNLIAWGCDQATPFYTRGVGSTYNGSAWSALGTGTDFVFQIYTGRRTLVYSRLSEVEALTRHFTDKDDKQYNATTNPTIFDVLDFEESTSDTVDAWLAGAGISSPLSTTEAQAMIRNSVNYCVALNCEMTARSAGFRSQDSETRPAAFKSMCAELHDDLAKNGIIAKGIKDAEGNVSASGASGLTAGQIEKSERDASLDDDTLIQSFFQTGMWDNQ